MSMPTPSPPTVEQWFESPRIQTLITSDAFGWENVRLNFARLIPGKDYAPLPQIDDYFIVAPMQGATHVSVRHCTPSSIDDILAPGRLQLVPPKLTGVSKWESPVISSFIQFSPAMVKSLADGLFRGDPQHLQMTPIFSFQDDLLFMLASALYNELLHDNPSGALYAESISQTMMIHLLVKYSNITVKTARFSTQLTAAQVRLLETYIEEHLDQKITLADLSRCLHVSVSHFERMFRASFGCAPYRYVLRRRIERAKWLLAHSEVSLHEVAYHTGFANQSHFTRHFSKFVGSSPARYREVLKN